MEVKLEDYNPVDSFSDINESKVEYDSFILAIRPLEEDVQSLHTKSVSEGAHNAIKWESVSFRCTVCSEEFVQENQYYEHMGTHEQESDGGCDSSQVCEPGAAAGCDSPEFGNRRLSHKMGDRLTDSQMLSLVEAYRENECLWNIKCTSYKNRHARERAYRDIANKLKIPGVTKRDIPKKIKNMRSSYYQELKKIKRSSRSGQDAVYRPRVSWFNTADGFLRNFRFRQELSNTDKNSNSSLTKEVTSQNIESIEYVIEEDCDTTDKHTNDNHNNGMTERDHTETSQFIAPTKRPLKKRRKIIQKDEEIHKAIKKIDIIAKSLANAKNSLIGNKEDEFDVFGKYIATALRSLPGELAIVAKTDVQKVLSDMQLKALKRR